MAEVKNAFLKARMNKDLDDRLMPPGEYRHAVNIQVSTAESSDIGALQNVLGNTIEKLFSDMPSDSSCIGHVADEANDSIYLFFTDNNSIENKPTYINSGAGSNHSIRKYHVPSRTSTTLVEGAFLNFHKSYPVFGVNILEDLLFWTDNRNQPRKINVTNRAQPGFYSTEDNISVAKYNPYQAMNVYKESEIALGEYESSMKDVTSKVLPNGGTAFVNGGITNASVVVIQDMDIPIYPNVPAKGMTVKKLDANKNILPITNGGSEVDVVLSADTPLNGFSLDLGVNVDLNTGDELIFNPNPYYIEEYPGDPNINQDKFLRFSYRFKFIDGEYSLIAPYTQICFIPKQDGYFLMQDPSLNQGDEKQAYDSSIVSFMQNKVTEVKLQLPLPFEGSSLASSLHVSEIDILSSESDSNITKVIETIPIEDLASLNSSVYEYVYQSKKPYKTLTTLDTTRVYDKIPVKALGQEVVSNRVVYANYQDKHTPPSSIDYNVAVSPKSEFNLFEVQAQVSGDYIDSDSITLSSVSGELIVGSTVTFAGLDSEFYVVEVDEGSNLITLDNPVTINNGTSVLLNARGAAKNTSSVEYPNSNLKSNRNYQVGVVLSDRFGRQSTVVLSSSNETVSIGDDVFGGSTLYAPYLDESVEINGWFGNSLKVIFNEPIGENTPTGLYNGNVNDVNYNPLGWYSYKVVVKQTEQEYYNVYCSGAVKGLLEGSGASDYNKSFITLVNDNINKVPRDLAEVGPQDKKFRSSVRLFGRVENYKPVNADMTNKQFYPDTGPFIATSIEGLYDMFNVADYTSSLITEDTNPYYSFYRGNADPFVAEISTSQVAGQQFGVDTALTTTPGTYLKAESLTVLETAPVESRLDIFWETSTSGKLSDLNALVKNDSSGVEGVEGWNVIPNFKEDAEKDTSFYGGSNDVLYSITGASGFSIINGLGITIPTVPNAGAADVAIESLTLTSVQTLEDTPTEVYNISDPRFELEDLGDNTYKIWTIEPDTLTSDFNWVCGVDSNKNKSFVFNFTVVSRNMATGELSSTDLTERADLQNQAPQFVQWDPQDPNTAPVPHTYASTYTMPVDEEYELDVVYVNNGANLEINTPTVLYSGAYEGLTASFITTDLHGNIKTGVNSSLEVVIRPNTVTRPFDVRITKPAGWQAPGDYLGKLTIQDAAAATSVYDFQFTIEDWPGLTLTIPQNGIYYYQKPDGTGVNGASHNIGDIITYRDGTHVYLSANGTFTKVSP